jgi:sulfate transport system permease protein
MRFRSHSVLPGFAPTLGFSLLYLSLMVLLPLSALVLYSVTKQDMGQFWQVVSNPRVVASFKLSFGAAAVAALLNTLFGSIIAWILVRYQFFGKRIMDALIDLPFAMPTAVSGIALSAIFAGNGWIGQYVAPYGIKLASNPVT